MVGDTAVTICNGALAALGEDAISSLSDATKRAQWCNRRYDPMRREVLRLAPWSCARKLVQITASATAPLFGKANAYPLPSDFIRLYDVEQDQALDALGWELVGNSINADQTSPLDLRYVYDLQDPTQMDALLVSCISLRLAAELALPLTQSRDKRDQAFADFRALLPEARTATSQENSPVEFDDDVWLSARY